MIRRRLYAEIRFSKLALWSWRIAVFAIPVVLFAIMLHRLGAVEYNVAYVLLAAGFAIALIAGLLAAAGFVVIWNDGLRGLGSAIVAFVISAAILGFPLFEAARSAALPPIADITTDFKDPPRFAAVALSRPRGANAPLYAGGETSAMQRAAYPAVKPLEVDASPDEAFNTVSSLVEQNGWRVLDSISPRSGERDGLIEAVALTPVMGFREDVSIRIRQSENGVVIDMRSASRYGKSDFGSNARRVEFFMRQITAARRASR